MNLILSATRHSDELFLGNLTVAAVQDDTEVPLREKLAGNDLVGLLLNRKHLAH